MATVSPAFRSSLRSTLTRGNIDSHRTSTVSLMYKPRTMPTPWPFLLLSFSLDLVTALWSAGGWGVAPFLLQKIEGYIACIENRMAHRRSTDEGPEVNLEQRSNWGESSIWCAFKRGFEALGLYISVLRSIAAFTLAVMSTRDDRSRFLSASAIAGLLFSSVPYWGGQLYAGYHHGLLRAAAMIASYMAYITHFIMFAYHDNCLKAGNHDSVIGNHDSYGKWVLTGGNCPVDIKDRELVEGWGLISKQAVGCGVERAFKPKYIRNSPGNEDANIIKLVEKFPNFGVLFFGGLVFATMFLCAVVPALICLNVNFVKKYYSIKKKLLGRETKTAEEERIPLLDEVEDAEIFDRDYAEFRATSFRVPKEAVNLAVRANCQSFSKFAAIVILVLAVISVPTHYVQETYPRTVTVIDNYGPLDNLTNTLSANITSWTDYFNIRAPSYDEDLRQRWWRENNRKIYTIVAVL